MPEPKLVYLKTGNPNLDQLLARDVEPGAAAEHGIVWESDNDEGDAPIVLILGAAGTGKTTLALQMATAIAVHDGGDDSFRVFFYSLEQSRKTLKWAHDNFGFASTIKDTAEFSQGGLKIEDKRIHLCDFAPLPLADPGTAPPDAFKDRFEQLNHVTKEAKLKLKGQSSGNGTPLLPVFFIDSLNAIALSDLKRNEVYRLFTLFRSKGIPAVFTAELREDARSSGSEITEDARFLADIVIELTSEPSQVPLLHYLQISKSRVRRQVVAKHLYRIRIPSKEGTPKREAGVVVFPSLPAMVEIARERCGQEVERYYQLYGLPKKDEAGANKPNTSLEEKTEKKRDFYKLLAADHVKAGACFSLVGPAGTHKLALGLNLAAGFQWREDAGADEEKRDLLIIAFGAYASLDLKRVAWFPDCKRWSTCKPTARSKGYKFEVVDFTSEDSGKRVQDYGLGPTARQLFFRAGYQTPEECFYEIQKEVFERRYSSVLVWDTAQVAGGFPLLRKEPLFLPSLIDLFHQKNLVSVFIGVREVGGPNLPMDSDLESAADYRLSFAHYPTAYDLASGIFGPAPDTPIPMEHREQLVSVVLDNVTGKHYGRFPRWLKVEQDTDVDGDGKERKLETKTLHCLETEDCQEWLHEETEKRRAEEAARRQAQEAGVAKEQGSPGGGPR